MAVELGQRAPDFELQTFALNAEQGESFKLSQHLGSKPVYLVFWATWCPICRAEIPNIKKIHQQLGDDIKIIAINIGQDDSVTAMREYQQQHQLPYSLGFDQDTKISRLYGVRGTPWQVIIDVNGVVRYRSHRTPEQLPKHISKLTVFIPNEITN